MCIRDSLKIHAISEIAKNKIESAGGTVEIIEEEICSSQYLDIFLKFQI